MTTSTPDRPRLPFTRCDGCGALDWPPWPMTHRHRPACPNDPDHPDNQ